MPYLTIFDYIISLSNPEKNFRTLRHITCCRNVYDEPILIVGGNAAVFKVEMENKTYALKCYTKLSERSEQICDYLSETKESLVYTTWFLPEELYIPSVAGDSAWRGICLTEWASGFTLEFEIRKALKDLDRERLYFLSRRFDDMAVELLGREWAHGDLKPENIMVSSDGDMKLIDTDALFIPSLSGKSAIEIGTPFYQHPFRTPYDYNVRIDDYSVAFISATLRTLAKNPELSKKYGNRDTLLFSPSEIIEGRSEAYEEAVHIARESGDDATCTLLREIAKDDPYTENVAEVINSR